MYKSLTGSQKKIVTEMLIDARISMNLDDINNYYYNEDDYNDYNDLYRDVVTYYMTVKGAA